MHDSTIPTPSPTTRTPVPYTTLFRSDRRPRGDGHSTMADRIIIQQNVADRLVGLDGTDELILGNRSEEHTSELQSRFDLVCRLLLETKNPHERRVSRVRRRREEPMRR